MSYTDMPEGIALVACAVLVLLVATLASPAMGRRIARARVPRTTEAVIQRARQKAESLVEVQRDLAEGLDLTAVLQKIVRHARRLCASDIAFLATCEPGHKTARVVAVEGARTEAFKNLAIDPRRGVGGRALQTGRPCSTASYLHEFDCHRDQAEQVRAEGLVAVLAVPMTLDHEVVGLLFVANRTARFFGREDEMLLLELALPAALAIRNSRLARELGDQRDLQLAKSRELARLARIVESSEDAIVGKTLDGIVTSWNVGAEGLYGYSADEILGRSISVLIPPEEAGELEQIMERLRGGERVTDFETVRITKGGERLEVSLSVSPILGEEGELAGASTIARDITEKKAIQRIKDEFIGTVSHELRTPLTAIKGNLELVLGGDGGPVTELQRRFLAVATENTDRLSALINDLLDVERLEAGKVHLCHEPLDLSGLLRGVGSTFALEAERKGLNLRAQIEDGLTIVGDHDRLVQVFANLLGNAIKYTLWGEVGIVATRHGGQVEVLVHDSGIGLTPAEQRQLFTRFFRSADAVAMQAGGTGLGLAISKGVVELHGGSIRVDSRKGKGTRFLVVLPEGEPAGPGLDPAASGQPTALVVEDETSIRNLFLDEMRRMGYRAVGAGEAATGLSLARELLPDLILLDLLMPAPDGWEVLLELRRDPATRDIPVVIHTIVEDSERGLRLGVHDCLVKPVDPSRLREVARAARRNGRLSIFLVDPDPGMGERLRRDLRGEGCLVRQAQSLAQARALRPSTPGLVLLSHTLPDGDAGELLRAWLRDPAFDEAVIILVGEWPVGLDAPEGVTTLRTEWGNGGWPSEAEVLRQVRVTVESLRGVPVG